MHDLGINVPFNENRLDDNVCGIHVKIINEAFEEEVLSSQKEARRKLEILLRSF